jgi:hypothetical protein
MKKCILKYIENEYIKVTEDNKGEVIHFIGSEMLYQISADPDNHIRVKTARQGYVTLNPGNYLVKESPFEDAFTVYKDLDTFKKWYNVEE